ncbi:MAG: RimK family alpha-L-glutamate ligase [Desulfurococcales archaeon]|nr:RimK family alpha-L-glutamate ligase [Desulfurococcales archaeon]
MEVLLAYDHPRWEEKELARGLREAGARVSMLNVARQPLSGSPGCVLVRPVSMYRAYYTSLYYSSTGSTTVNRPEVIRAAGDKVETLLLLSGRGIPVPRSMIALTGEAALAAGEAIGYPLVDKPPIGSWGRLVSLVRDPGAHRDIVEHRDMIPSPQLQVHIVQEVVEPVGVDVRCLYVFGEVPACMVRRAPRGEWRSNVARGAGVEPFSGGEAAELAARAGDAVGGGVVSVDILPGSGGMVVNEVNGVPEFRGLARASGLDIPGIIASAIVSWCRR